MKSDRGNTCSQIFVGSNSDRWEVFPLKTESSNGIALQDFTRKVGTPNIFKSDNAQSQTGATWTQHCRKHFIDTRTSEPNHPWHNTCEKRVGYLGAMVRQVMSECNEPLLKHDWSQKWYTDVHNILAIRSKKWRTHLELSTGQTLDISKFRFHFWEPIWFYEPTKYPKDNWRKGRWLGFASSTGDLMTYYIETEDTNPKQVIMRSGIKSRRKNIGMENEQTTDDPDDDNILQNIEDQEDITISNNGNLPPKQSYLKEPTTPIPSTVVIIRSSVLLRISGWVDLPPSVLLWLESMAMALSPSSGNVMTFGVIRGLNSSCYYPVVGSSSYLWVCGSYSFSSSPWPWPCHHLPGM